MMDYPDFISSCGYGYVDGLCGANCRHSFHAFLERVMERTYTDEQLESMKGENHRFTYEGREYDGYSASQKMREMERTLRALKRERLSFRAAGQDEDEAAVLAKITRLRQKYKEFSQASGEPEQLDRLNI